ncbi:unnamed protein product, partial [Ilex paraguariensis]
MEQIQAFRSVGIDQIQAFRCTCIQGGGVYRYLEEFVFRMGELCSTPLFSDSGF